MITNTPFYQHKNLNLNNFFTCKHEISDLEKKKKEMCFLDKKKVIST